MAVFSLSTVAGQQPILTARQTLAGLGTTFVVQEPTIGTGIAYAAKTSQSATANGFLLVQNNNPPGGKNIYFDRLALTSTASASTGTLVMHMEAVNEVGPVLMTGAVATATPVNLNTGLATPTAAVVQLFAAGAATVPSAVGTRKQVGAGFVATGLNVLGDVYTMDFGADGLVPQSRGGAAVRATDTAQISGVMPAVMVAPQTTTWINMWWLTVSGAPSFLVTFTYNEL